MAEYPKIYLYHRIVKAKLFIDRHFDQQINLGLIADEAFFSKFHFTRLFKKTYGRTPHQYLTWVRIEQAKLLLQKGQNVSDACFSVGFESLSSFTHLFKSKESISPSAFRKKEMLRRQRIARAPLEFVPNCFAEQMGWTKNSKIR